MATPNDMDKYVNWDDADDALGHAFPMDDPSALAGLTSSGPLLDGLNSDNLDLVLANVPEDDFSFCALQHFSENSFPLPGAPVEPAMDMDMDLSAPIDFWDTPDSPCTSCAMGGFSCKTIREGQYKGFCISCVALRVHCSFGAAPLDFLPDSSAAPLNPWPTTASQTLVNASVADDMPESGRSSRNYSVTDAGSLGNSSNDAFPAQAVPPPKIGARFSRESVRILKNWLATHNRHPYPSDEEKEMLQRQTGLNKTQITNWLANTRRRSKVHGPPRSTSPHPNSFSGAIDIPRRRGTPALEAMSPLQRWEHSPPENEPASVAAIARAVTASSSGGMSSGLSSPYGFNYTDDGSSRSLCNQSSASSLGTSHSSNGSSAYSFRSRNSFGSFGSGPLNNKNRRRRRRRTSAKTGGDGNTELGAPLKTFQCTFCTETFRTKHDWQRHEKSLHLSLERWVCSPHGPRAVNPENGQMSCVFCGLDNPDDEHIESHNHSACQERTPEERTFYRKDHLNQHLRLVHNVKFTDWSMKSWKVATPEIRSRCGFCGIVMDTWTIRVDHLAEHFKTGYSMADWKGDWGFEMPVLDMVENSIPPYLIHYERNSPYPYIANQSPPESPRNAYELIKLELAYYMHNYEESNGRLPGDEELMVEGCRIIFASEVLSLRGVAAYATWLRDLIMSSPKLMEKAKFGPLRAAAENRMATLKINGKDNLFEECPMECQLQEFVKAKKMLGLTAMDDELQEEACRIVGRVEEVSTHPSDIIANWLLRLITSSTDWLGSFRRRAHLPRSEDLKDIICRSTDPNLIDSTVHSYSRLEQELAEFLEEQRAKGVEPTDDDLQRKARIIIYEFDDGWNQTAADNISWLEGFRRRHALALSSVGTETSPAFSLQPSTGSAAQMPTECTNPTTVSPNHCSNVDAGSPSGSARIGKFFLNDANCYQRLAKELRRWVTSTMSPNNPNQHVPSDAELQHQARFILYDDDDPWNQTAADNAEWLQRFKRTVGIIKEPGPGLPMNSAWAIEQGGTGFEPPYACPRGAFGPFQDNVQVSPGGGGGKSFQTGQCVANSYVEKLTSASARPATIFCSRELERGLIEFVEDHVSKTGHMPSDSAIQTRGRDILDVHHTAADDPDLLSKFKDMMSKNLPQARPAGPGAPAEAPSAVPSNMVMNMSDEEINNILQDMDFDFDVNGMGDLVLEGTQNGGGVSLTGFKD